MNSCFLMGTLVLKLLKLQFIFIFPQIYKSEMTKQQQKDIREAFFDGHH